ncbi:toll/interleukin-1 receptor domain-containing protein [Pseudomonas sp. SWRI99]|uniref:toll/interleukin-1 receptor domain-containing protein n=1 Tax=Pseudomonas sp. SWRI99 TaxID=2745506 RepID=UPI0016453F58|nr:toll/interleukin-1 receptor domain-containing protein [Pseudomonas sp. SWRI99]MBC3776356.1 TIR domain-containing protein [Pseudomonas sp. SWRI99]
MSISTLTNTINRLQRELADISKSVSQETKKESDLLSRIGQIQRTITKSTTLSALNTKRSEIERKQKEIATVAGKKAALAKKEADKNNQLLKARQDLSKEEERERKRISTAREREIRKENDLLRQGQVSRLMLEREINAERAAPTSLSEAQSSLPTLDAEPEVEYDLFISHASNDKKDLVEPLVEALQALGVKVWYDNQALRVGDSLRKKIDQGLSNSRFGTVVLSSAFFAKQWPQYELDGMTALEMNGRKMILPIWHKTSKSEVIKFSPTLADKVALNSSTMTIEEIANELAEVVLDC